MKKLLISTAAIALLFGAASAAPGDDNDNNRHKGPQAGQMAGPANNAADTRREKNQNAAENRQDANQAAAMKRQDANQAAAMKRQDANQAAAMKRQNANQAAAAMRQDKNQNAAQKRQELNRNAAQNRQNANRGRNNVDLTKYRRNVTASRRFHAQAYHGPSGYRYQRWSYGQRMPSIYWARNYWLTDFLSFGLMSPPDGYTWVRYGNDAVMIDEYTGDIVQVEYNVFY